MVNVIPELDEVQDNTQTWVPTEEEKKRGLRSHKRIRKLLEARQPYEPPIERGLYLYDGVSLEDPKKRAKIKNEEIVAPFARIFVEAKTAEEVKASSKYEFIPVEDAGDAWKVRLLKEVDIHVRRTINYKQKRAQMKRMKNIAGVSVARVGYRRVMRTIKERTETDEFGDLLVWKEVEVPAYDDLFMDVVSPLNFAVDPNALSMNDAMDCVHFHAENYESFYETYANDKRFKNIEHVRVGNHGMFLEDAFSDGHFRSQRAQEDMVVISEYFNKIRDEWLVYANGVEIYWGPLPDDHKELPFVSEHNNPTFVSGIFNSLGKRSDIARAYSRTSDGKETTTEVLVTAEERFWTQGDPQTIVDLIDLRTSFGRAAYRAIKLAGEAIVATAGNAMFDETRSWKTGDQAKGMMGKFQVASLGSNVGLSGYQFAFDDLFNLMILTTGVDPRALSDQKTKTATEAAIQRETSMRRLQENIEFNEENGEVRMGRLMHKLIQQRYTKPEIARITGDESALDMKSFDEVIDEGGQRFGKRYRRIPTSFNIKESADMKSLSKDDAGVSSFIARPEYIRTSDIDIRVRSNRDLGQIQAIEGERARAALELVTQLLPLTQPTIAGQEPLLSAEDLPNVRKLSEKLAKSLGLDPDTDIGQTDEEVTEEDENIEQLKMDEEGRQPLNANLPLGTAAETIATQAPNPAALNETA